MRDHKSRPRPGADVANGLALLRIVQLRRGRRIEINKCNPIKFLKQLFREYHDASQIEVIACRVDTGVGAI